MIKEVLVRKVEVGTALHLMYRLQAAMTPHLAGLGGSKGHCRSQPHRSRANGFVKAEGPVRTSSATACSGL